MKRFSFVAAVATFGIGLSSSSGASSQSSAPKPDIKEEKPVIVDVQAGQYLAGRFAQKNHDWENANAFIHKLIKSGIASDGILQRAMILAMGSGTPQEAINIAKHIKEQTPDNSNTVAEIFLIAEAFKSEDYKKAEQLFDALPNDGTTKFIGPFVKGWLNAAQGHLNIESLTNNTVQLYHGILISDFLQDHSDIEKIIDNSLNIDDINPHEQERIADLYGHIGLKDKAMGLYKAVLNSQADNQIIKAKLSKLEQGKNDPLFKKVSTANNGMAKAFHDISNILYNEKNSESARVFAHVALYIEPDLASAKSLLAKISTDHKQYDKAITYYASITNPEEDYIQAQHNIVDIYEETERYEDALTLLKNLSSKHQEIGTFIKIGNLHRHQENFKLALDSYNMAIKKLGGTITEDYWHLHYVRGIAYEQMDDWDSAEKELKAALAFQPNHPYVLNYLGYAWADKGVNLQKSLRMIQRAVDLRPSDGYITDSLGWVMYRVKDYKNAVPVLERAVELLPYDPTVNDHLGDAYWKVGRILEAKFQWKRAKNHSNDDKQVKDIEEKLASGIQNKSHTPK